MGKPDSVCDSADQLQVIDELDEKVGMIKIETDETCAQCQADLGVQCDSLQCKKQSCYGTFCLLLFACRT